MRKTHQFGIPTFEHKRTFLHNCCRILCNCPKQKRFASASLAEAPSLEFQWQHSQGQMGSSSEAQLQQVQMGSAGGSVFGHPAAICVGWQDTVAMGLAAGSVFGHPTAISRGWQDTVAMGSTVGSVFVHPSAVGAIGQDTVAGGSAVGPVTGLPPTAGV